MCCKEIKKSKGEYLSVKSAVGSMDAFIDENSKAYTEQFIKHLSRTEDIEERSHGSSTKGDSYEWTK